MHPCHPYLKDVFGWCDRDCLVIGNVDVHLSGCNFFGERSEEGDILFLISHSPSTQCQSIGYILLVSGMDPETEKNMSFNCVFFFSLLRDVPVGKSTGGDEKQVTTCGYFKSLQKSASLIVLVLVPKEVC